VNDATRRRFLQMAAGAGAGAAGMLPGLIERAAAIAANSPTGTVGALACWAADSIKDHYLKRPGPLV
jgi:hypothetical protein